MSEGLFLRLYLIRLFYITLIKYAMALIVALLFLRLYIQVSGYVYE